MDIPYSLPVPSRKAIIPIAALALIVALWILLPAGPHWERMFKPAAVLLLQGKNPYDVIGFYNPPWALVPVIPFILLPDKLASAVMVLVSVSAIGYAAHRLGADTLLIALLILNPATLTNAANVNLDWMPVLALFMPPWIGMFFAAVKPQIGIGLILYWIYEAWKDGGAKRAVKITAPVVVAHLLSFAIYGLWPLRFSRVVGAEWNISMWPASIPFGLALLAFALRRKEKHLSLTAAPMLSPYFGVLHTAVVGLVPYRAEAYCAIAGLWIIWLWKLLAL